MSRRSAALLAAVAGLPACVEVTDCTTIGCVDGVTVMVHEELPVQMLPFDVIICADDATGREVCDVQPVEQGQLDPVAPTVFAQLPLAVDSEQNVTVSVRVRAGSGEILIDASGTGRFQGGHPNGEDCPPTCYSASFEYDADTNTLIELTA